MTQWFALQTQPRSEDRAVAQLMQDGGPPMNGRGEWAEMMRCECLPRPLLAGEEGG